MTFNDYDLPISCYDVNKDYGFRTGYWKNKKLDEYSNDYLVKAMEYCVDHNRASCYVPTTQSLHGGNIKTD